jgi:hypothetical protein
MTKTRLTSLGCLMLLLAWYISSALPASATPDPPPGYYPSPAARLPAGPPAQPTVVHDHISPWSYVLIVGLTIVATLVAVALAARGGARPSGAPNSQPQPDHERTIMPLYMDVHAINGGVTADDVVAASTVQHREAHGLVADEIYQVEEGL